MSFAPSPVDSLSHAPPPSTPSSNGAPTPGAHASSPEHYQQTIDDIMMNGSHQNVNGTRKTTRPSMSIQANADRLLDVFTNEKAKLTTLYQKNLSVLEAQFNDYKAKSKAELSAMGQKEELQQKRIDALQAEVDEKKKELELLKAALNRARLVYLDGEVKSAG